MDSSCTSREVLARPGSRPRPQAGHGSETAGQDGGTPEEGHRRSEEEQTGEQKSAGSEAWREVKHRDHGDFAPLGLCI